jgi:type 2A phosphatase activator TIP41
MRRCIVLTGVQRVMPSCIFILSRFTLRVDNVLFRTFDTRMYHSFSSSLVVREVSGWEAPYERVKRVSKRCPNRDAFSIYIDALNSFSISQRKTT